MSPLFVRTAFALPFSRTNPVTSQFSRISTPRATSTRFNSLISRSGRRWRVGFVEIAAGHAGFQRRFQCREFGRVESFRGHRELAPQKFIGVRVVLERLLRQEHEEQPLRFPLAGKSLFADELLE